MAGIEIINKGIGYIQQGLEWFRNLLIRIAGFLPIDAELSVMVLFLAASLLVGHFIVKRFVTRPFQLSYLPWLLIISVSIFLNLYYL